MDLKTAQELGLLAEYETKHYLHDLGNTYNDKSSSEVYHLEVDGITVAIEERSIYHLDSGITLDWVNVDALYEYIESLPQETYWDHTEAMGRDNWD